MYDCNGHGRKTIKMEDGGRSGRKTIVKGAMHAEDDCHGCMQKTIVSLWKTVALDVGGRRLRVLVEDDCTGYWVLVEDNCTGCGWILVEDDNG